MNEQPKEKSNNLTPQEEVDRAAEEFRKLSAVRQLKHRIARALEKWRGRNGELLIFY